MRISPIRDQLVQLNAQAHETLARHPIGERAMNDVQTSIVLVTKADGLLQAALAKINQIDITIEVSDED